MNTKVSTRSNSKMAEYLNEQLAVENAVVDRLVTRIHETPISDLKQHLEKKLRQTMNRQERMYQVINGLGVKPTDTKANLPSIKMPHRDNIKELKDKVESLTIHDKEVAKSAENEIHKIKEDLIIEKAGVISYKILLRLAEQANIQDAIDTLKQNLEEEQSMSDWITDNASAMIDELWPKIESSLIE
jgi:ferritin-like metal-binding protein YciE